MAVHMLALVLSLSLAAPSVGLAADLAFHAGGPHGRSEAPALDATASSVQVDPGLGEHLHCGCHQAARVETGSVAPPAVPGRPLAAGLERALPSITPDRLPRPPRA
jgi:hypothetical protein